MCFGRAQRNETPGLFCADTGPQDRSMPAAYQTRHTPITNPTAPVHQRGSAATAVHRHLHERRAVSSTEQSDATPYDSVHRKPASTQGQASEVEDPFEFLSHFDTCFVIDDSTAMVPCWDEVKALIFTLVPLCTERDTSGIDIYFGNHKPAGALFGGIERTGYRHIGIVSGMPQMHDNVEGIFNDVKPRGRHRVTSRLLDILDEYMLQYRLSVQATDSAQHVKPINIIVVTAQPLSDRVPKHIQRLAKALDEMKAPSHQLGIQFFQVGNDEQARHHMQLLDDALHAQQGVRDIVDTATWTDGPGKLSAKGVWKVLGGAVRRSVDLMRLEELRMPAVPKDAW